MENMKVQHCRPEWLSLEYDNPSARFRKKGEREREREEVRKGRKERKKKKVVFSSINFNLMVHYVTLVKVLTQTINRKNVCVKGLYNK